ncbi:hypothetical protein [Limnoglobus roseus]|uniref:Uncharacterized protein n=1 Tax=Limnoglobus roseus TaxID=2598579 RepID=A0A5C1AN33_9BACT|nr:hypothetical protein [Limnoglobus roseus]QEL18614.1 hypothetical protein PX52LOC_05647 [Limnoglobus roseus]
MNSIDQSARWAILYRRPGSRVWLELGTAGTEAQASAWLLRFFATGDYRIRRPSAAKEAARA